MLGSLTFLKIDKTPQKPPELLQKDCSEYFKRFFRKKASGSNNRRKTENAIDDENRPQQTPRMAEQTRHADNFTLILVTWPSQQGVGRARYQNQNFGNAVTKLQFLKKKFCKKE